MAERAGNRTPTGLIVEPPRRGRLKAVIGLLVLLIIAGLAVARFAAFEYFYLPSMAKVANPERWPAPAYDIWGESISAAEAEAMAQTPEGRTRLSAAAGAVRIDDQLLADGRRAFYGETFSNEYFLTDVMGVLDGPLTATGLVGALVRLGGRGTNNLRVRLAEDITIGDRLFRRGELVDTGIDVPRGAFAPIGFKVRWERGRLLTGIACAVCHVTVDEHGNVLEGVPNPNLNMGLLIAMATNSAAYFGRTDIDVANREDLYTGEPRTAPTSGGGSAPLPDPIRLEALVSAQVLKWPPGNFDTMVDLESSPTRIPDSFTRGDDPFGWTGFSSIGPFRGLNTLGNNVHAFNADPLIEAHAAPLFFELDTETYIAVLLQNAANRDFRYDPGSGLLPSEFKESVDPYPGLPGFAEVAVLPSFPRSTALAPHSIVVSRHGAPIWYDLHAMSAFQDTLKPPVPPIEPVPEKLRLGREIFRHAGCADCHAGPAFTNNRIVPRAEIGTEPERAGAMKRTREIFDPQPTFYALDTPVPVPADAEVVDVPWEHLRSREEIALSMAHDGEGGYKVKGLVGLYWTPPYLHTGAVAVGPDPAAAPGLPGTLLRNVLPDARNSLRAMVDRDWRAQVTAANRESEAWEMQAWAIGHEYWVDEESGYGTEEQDALLHYLLLLGHHEEARPPDQPAPVSAAGQDQRHQRQQHEPEYVTQR
jgi:hypothetical protein